VDGDVDRLRRRSDWLIDGSGGTRVTGAVTASVSELRLLLLKATMKRLLFLEFLLLTSVLLERYLLKNSLSILLDRFLLATRFRKFDRFLTEAMAMKGVLLSLTSFVLPSYQCVLLER